MPGHRGRFRQCRITQGESRRKFAQHAGGQIHFGGESAFGMRVARGRPEVGASRREVRPVSRIGFPGLCWSRWMHGNPSAGGRAGAVGRGLHDGADDFVAQHHG